MNNREVRFYTHVWIIILFPTFYEFFVFLFRRGSWVPFFRFFFGGKDEVHKLIWAYIPESQITHRRSEKGKNENFKQAEWSIQRWRDEERLRGIWGAVLYINLNVTVKHYSEHRSIQLNQPCSKLFQCISKEPKKKLQIKKQKKSSRDSKLCK